MSPAGGSNEKPILYDDLSEIVKRGDLIRSANVEDRVYLVLDKHSCIHSNTVYLTLLSPEGATLSGSPELWYDMFNHALANNVGAENWKASMLFSILPRSTSSSRR